MALNFQLSADSKREVGVACSVMGLLGAAVWYVNRRRPCEAPVMVPARVGFFTGRKGATYYRENEFSALYEATPTSVTLTSDGPKGVVHTMTLVDEGVSESILMGSEPPRPAINLPNFLVGIGLRQSDRSVISLGMGWREGEYLFTARHMFQDPSKQGYKATTIVLFTRTSQEDVELSDDDIKTLGGRFRSRHGTDVLALKVPKWPKGVRSVAPSIYTFDTTGPCEVYGVPSKDFLVSHGTLVDDVCLSVDFGLVSHTCSTSFTFSGSPLLVNNNGRFQIAGLHISGCGPKGIVNYAAGAWALHKLRDLVGLVPHAGVGSIYSTLVSAFFGDNNNESREKKKRQAEWEWRMEQMARAEMEDELNELMHGELYMREGNESPDQVRSRTLLPRTLMLCAENRNESGGWVLVAWLKKALAAGFNYPVGESTMATIIEEGKRKGSLETTFWQGKLWARAVELPCSPPPFLSLSPASPAPEPEAEIVPSAPRKADIPPDMCSTLASSENRNESRPLPAGRLMWDPKYFPLRNAAEAKNRDEHVFWAKNREETIEPSPARELTVEQKVAFKDWMSTGNWESLAALKDAGPIALLQEPGMEEFRSYLAVGDRRMAPPKEHKDGITRLFNSRGKVHAERCGTVKPLPGKPREMIRISDEVVASMAAIGVDVAGWVLPPTGKAAVFASLKGQVARQRPGSWVKLVQRENVLADMDEFCGSYPATRPCTTNTFAEGIDLYLDGCDATKSTGWSARYLPGPKGAWKTAHGRNLLAYLVQARLALQMACATEIHKYSAEACVELGLRDPEEVFVKDEAHGPEKVQSERWRLIWICSIVDASVQDLLHHAQNKEDITAFQRGTLTTQGVGMGHHDIGVQQTGRVFDMLSKAGTQMLHCSDASGWDLSVCADAIYFDAQRRISRFSEVSSLAADLMYCQAAVNSRHCLVIGSGLYALQEYGTTASGIPSTSGQNSPIRAFGLIAFGANAAHAMSDDEVHGGAVDVAGLASTGVITKGEMLTCPPGGPVNFTSHDYIKREDGTWIAVFRNVSKMFAHLELRRIGDEPPAQDTLAGARFALRHNPEATRQLELLCLERSWHLPAAADTGFDV